MTADAMDTEYENGVADVLAFLAGDTARVYRNVGIRGAKSGIDRQIDVVVKGCVFGVDDATMVVDGKRYIRPIDVNTVGTFTALVEDVGANFGLLVTTTGASEAARDYARKLRSIHLDILSLDELASWSPKGTVHFDYAVPDSYYSEAARSVRRAGFRVKSAPVGEWRSLPGHLGLRVFRHFGVPNPSAEVQKEAEGRLLAALHKVGVADPIALGSGVVVSGGTPGHRWLEVSFSGKGTGEKVLVSSEQDISTELERLAQPPGAQRGLLDIIRPDVWPIPVMFPTLN